MTNRVFPQPTRGHHGLIAIVENQRVVLPLKAVECDFSVAGGMVRVRMTQIFRQENPKALDCEYLFPLPADASVYACEADINGRIIRAVVKEREEAVKLAAEKKAEGRRVALVEAERENLFTLSLSNLQPQDLILVTIKYLQPLRRLADRPSVEIPFCPGIRYIPGNSLIRSNRGKGTHDDTDQVPDASRISPVRLEREHPDAAFIEITGRIDDRGVEAASITSPSHEIISKPEEHELVVRLSEQGTVPDRDFVLRWEEPSVAKHMVKAWVCEHGEKTYALIEIRAPQATGLPVPMDFYFLVDRSGSMQGVKWEKAALAVQTCVKNLAKEDRVMVTFFNSQFNDFAEAPLPPERLLGDSRFQSLASVLPPGGGTEMGPALKHVTEVAGKYSGDRARALILITDAQVGNEAGILEILQAAPGLPTHCFGIDINLNDALLQALARQQQGTFHSLNPADDVVKEISDMAQVIRHPVLRDLQLPDVWENADRLIPPLYSGQVFRVSVTGARRTELSLMAKGQEGDLMRLPCIAYPASSTAPYLRWCKQRIQRCLAEKLNAEAVELSVKSNLICPLTAFIAWDEAEKVAVARHAMVQPVMLEELDLTHVYSIQRLSDRGIRSRMVGSKSMRLGATQGSQELPGGLASAMADITKMAARMEGPGSTHEPDPFTMVQRWQAIERLNEHIYLRCTIPELKGLLDRIMQWAFESEPDAARRSHLVAVLLVRLLPKSAQIMTHRRLLISLMAEWETKGGRLDEVYLRLKELLAGRQLSEAQVEQIAQMDNRPGLADDLAQFKKLNQEIREEVNQFGRQWVGWP